MTGPLTLWTCGDWQGLEALRTGLAVRTALAAAPEDADVVLLATAADVLPRDEVAHVREHTGAPVLLLAAQRSAFLLQEAVEQELADVVLLPQTAETILFAAEKALRARSLRDDPRRGAARVITVFSPKGGTGKSTTATNVAASLAASGRRTLLLDLDVHFGDAAIMLGLEPERTLYDVITAPGTLDAEKLTAYATRHESGLHVLAAPLRPEDTELVTDVKVAEILAAATPAYEAIVVDTAPFFHQSVLAALDRTDDLLLVVAPDVPTLKNVRLALQTLELLAFPEERLRVVLNRASARLGFRAPEVGAVLERGVDFELPDDEIVGIGVNRGTPAVLYRGQAPFSQAVAALAGRLLAGTAADRPQPRRRLLALGRRR